MTYRRFAALASGALLALATTPTNATLVASRQSRDSRTTLLSSQVRATVGPMWIDMEEDAELAALPEPTDAGTGQFVIKGEFHLPPSTVVTGCLFWNGDTLLMGKLRARPEAQTNIDSILSPIGGRAFDPLLVEKVNDTTYSLQIFPVPKGIGRRVRLRYLVPVTSRSGETPVAPALAREVSNTATTTWRLELRSNGVKNVSLKRDGLVWPISLPSTDMIPFPMPGSTVAIQWGTTSSTGERAVRTRMDSGDWAGDFVLYTGRLPDSIARKVEIRSETVFLWRWIQPSSFLYGYGYYGTYLSSYGSQAVDQAAKLWTLSGKLGAQGGKVGLVADQGMDDTTIVFPLSDSTGSTFRNMRTWLAGVTPEYLQWRIPAPEYGTTPGPTSLELSHNRRLFRQDIVRVGSLYSADSGIVRHLLVVTVGPVPSGGDFLDSIGLDGLPPGVTVGSTDFQTGPGTYGDDLTFHPGPLTRAKWPGVNLDAAIRARPDLRSTLAPIDGVPLPGARTRVAARLTIATATDSFSNNAAIDRGPDGTWTTSINVHATGLTDAVRWKFFDTTGRTIASYVAHPAWVVSPNDSAIPRLWATTPDHLAPSAFNLTSLAPVFGFIDAQYSLLARPGDTLGNRYQIAYADSGVPWLSAGDIFAHVGIRKPTGIQGASRTSHKLSVRIHGLGVEILYPGLRLASLEIRDLRGRLQASWSRAALAGRQSVEWIPPRGAGLATHSFIAIAQTESGPSNASFTIP